MWDEEKQFVCLFGNMLSTTWLISKNFHQIPYIPHFKSTPPYRHFFPLRPTNLPQILHFKIILSSKDVVWASSNKNTSVYYRATGSKFKGLPLAVRSVEAHRGGPSFSWIEKRVVLREWCCKGHRACTQLSSRWWPQPPSACAWKPQRAMQSGLQFSRQKLSQFTVRNTV